MYGPYVAEPASSESLIEYLYEWFAIAIPLLWKQFKLIKLVLESLDSGLKVVISVLDDVLFTLNLKLGLAVGLE